MFQNTKLLVFSTILLLFLGFSLIGYSFYNQPQVKESPVDTVTTVQKEDHQQTASPSALLLPPLATPSSVLGIEGTKAQVTKVTDGDTFEIDSGEKVRMVGIDTPETVDPKRPIGCFGKEASNETKGLLTGKKVILQKDITDKDKYGRILRLVYLPLENGEVLFVNDYLVRAGFAKAYKYPPDIKFSERFKMAEDQAKEGKIGMWGSC